MSSGAQILSWPLNIPLPAVDFNGAPSHTTLASGLENARIQRRERYKSVAVTISVRWVLGVEEYDNFKDLFATDLDNGAAQFLIPLRYPKNSELTEWKARFIEGFTAVYEDHNWMIEAELDLLEVVEVETPIPSPMLPVEAHGFLVVSEDVPGTWESFVDVNGSPYYVVI